MTRLRVPTILALALAWQPALADADLTVRAVETRALIVPRQAGQQTRLPSLQFSVRAEFDCADDAVAESITISVADAYERYVPAEGAEALEAAITLPGNQIAAITTGDFCVNGEGDDELLLAGVATAQVSLRCRDQSGASISFASLLLPLRLVCERGDDQEPSVGVSSPAR